MQCDQNAFIQHKEVVLKYSTEMSKAYFLTNVIQQLEDFNLL